jgi:hypothetical protein
MKAFITGFCIVSIALVLLSSIPCYAQVETQRFLTPGRTAWNIINSEFAFEVFDHLGFFAGSVWIYWTGSDHCIKCKNSHYRNWIISKFRGDASFTSSYWEVSGYVIPFLNTGTVTICGLNRVIAPWQCFYCNLTIDDDNFIPY